MAEYLKSLGSIRERTQLVLQQPQHLQHFDVHLDQMDAVVNAVMMLIVRDYSSPTDIPPHSRWRHFEAASSRWSFHPQSEQTGESEKDKAASSYNRSEGLALASLEWFMAGGLSSDTDAHPLRADATACSSHP
ncbi:hypothetical protein BSLG_003591 [Batrachochytrium salamandrivorans]|nr:hypothetical protein BSLG_003591 [Batrachochytrium salamandrivorans]